MDAVARFPASHRRLRLSCAKSRLDEFLASQIQVRTLVGIDADRKLAAVDIPEGFQERGFVEGAFACSNFETNLSAAEYPKVLKQ